MFGRKGGKKDGGPPAQKERRAANLSQFGLMDVPGVDQLGNLDSMLDDDGDDDLEAELAALMTSGGAGKRKPAKARPNVDLDSMVAECMKDYDSNDDLSDTEDPDLMAELQDISFAGEPNDGGGGSMMDMEPVGRQQVDDELAGGASLLFTIQSRISNYSEAERVAKINGETSRARRFNRGLNTLKDLEKQVKAGRPVNEDDIPPVVVVGKPKEIVVSPTTDEDGMPAQMLSAGQHSSGGSVRPAPPPPLSVAHPGNAPVLPPRGEAPPLPPSARSPATSVHSAHVAPMKDTRTASTSGLDSDNPIAVISARRNELKSLALAAKNSGDKASAINLMRSIKVCDALLESAKAGENVDLSQLPSGSGVIFGAPVGPPPASEPAPASEVGVALQQPPQMIETERHLGAEATQPPGAPAQPTTIKEALLQRLDKYKSEETRAKNDGNASKARRMGRIVKQYEEALKLHKAGRPIPRGDLPDPPGFPPIPTHDAPADRASSVPPHEDPSHAAPIVPPAAASGAAVAPSSGNDGGNVASPSKPDDKTNTPPKAAAAAAGGAAAAAASIKGGVHRQTSIMTLQEKQLMALQKKQKLFKEAALQAKQQGQTDTAKEYLRQALAFNKVIEASKAGLPVDMTSLPVPPQLQVKTNMDFEIVSREDCQITGDREEMYSKLESDLIAQVKMCMTNRTYFKEVGDIASSNKFEQMAVHSKKDLDSIRFAFKRGDPVPKFHYETRAFSRVVCNTDLTDNDLELSILSGINYITKNSKEPDTYVKWEFPFPRDAPVMDKTNLVKDSNNPVYESVHKLVINPRDKTFQRLVKRAAIKLEVWCRGGFLRSDILMGTANVKLAPLETACEIHDSFDLYEGRKPVGGKVEVKIRLRNPIVSKQIQQTQEKWLVIQF